MLVKVQSAEELNRGIYYEYETDSLPLGQGGMGVVYQGYCFQESNRDAYIPVALKKILNPSQDLISRAMREASVQVDHENLLLMFGFIPNYEYDAATQTSVLNYYIAMENLGGVNLENLINGQLVDKFGIVCEYAKSLHQLYIIDRFAFVRKIMKNVLNGTRALHNAGFIHRDLDPSNIMITHDGQIKIIDFGISKNLGMASSINRRLTSAGSKMGKIDYSAPEMMTGDVDKHNFSTDIYSLGIMAYQLCVGELPFKGSMEDVLKAQMITPVPVDNISDPVFRQVIAKATKKEQADRYQSVDEWIADFERLSRETYNTEMKDAYENAKKSTAPEAALRQYQTIYPDSPYNDEINTFISSYEESAAFTRISEESTVDELKAFLTTYPNGAHAGKATKLLKKKQNKPLSIQAWVLTILAGMFIGVGLEIMISLMQ